MTSSFDIQADLFRLHLRFGRGRGCAVRRAAPRTRRHAGRRARPIHLARRLLADPDLRAYFINQCGTMQASGLCIAEEALADGLLQDMHRPHAARPRP